MVYISVITLIAFIVTAVPLARKTDRTGRIGMLMSLAIGTQLAYVLGLLFNP